MEKYYFVYILTNPGNTVLYTGVTNDLKRRVYEHRNKVVPGFTAKHNVKSWFTTKYMMTPICHYQRKGK